MVIVPRIWVEKINYEEDVGGYVESMYELCVCFFLVQMV
jgi:hypothetical protein